MKKFATIIVIASLLGSLNAQIPQQINLGFGNSRKVKFSPKNGLIAFVVGNKVKLFRSGIHVASFSEHHNRINDFSIDEEGQFMLAGHATGNITLWDAKTRKILLDFKTDRPVVACQFFNSPVKIISISDKNLFIWSIEGETLIEVINSTGVFKSLALSDKNKLIATGGHGKINIWDDQGKSVKELSINKSWILSLAFSPDGKILASGSHDGLISLWDVETGQLLTTLLKTKGRINSLEFSNDGKYLAAGSEYFFLLSVTQDHPDVVYKKLNGAVISSSFSPDGKQICTIEHLTPFAKIYDISDLYIPPVFRFKDEGDIIAPQIYVSNPPKIVNNRVNYSKDLIDIQGSIFDDYGIRSLSINGIETPIKENRKFLIHLPLSKGENPVTLKATDVNGNSSFNKFTINRKNNSEEYDPTVARNYLFVAGVDNYQYWNRLNNAVKDGNDIARILMNKYNFEISNITILKDEQATRNNIYKGLRSLIEKITPQDNLIIYFSGHGYFDELLNEGYWIPVNANLNSEGEYLSNSSILKIIENINSQHTLLIADACFAGSLFTASNRGVYVDKVEKYKSRWGLASGRLEQVSDGQVGSNSPFTRVLLTYLRDNPKSEFTVSELIQHVKIKVSEQTGQTPIGNRLRLSSDEGGEFVFRKSL